MTAPSLFPDVEGNAARLQAWLQDRLEGFGGVMEVDRLHGGRSNPGWRLRTAHRDCVLRARPGPRAIFSAINVTARLRPTVSTSSPSLRLAYVVSCFT